MKHALVTGATGFIGSHLVPALIRKGVGVSIFRRPSSNLKNLQGLPFRDCTGDLLNKEDWRRAMEPCDAIFHLAVVGTYTRKDRQRRREVNVDAVQTLLDALRGMPDKRLLHVSSVAAVGISSSPDQVLDETSPFNARHLHYFATKREGEEKVLRGAKEGLDTVVVNPGFVAGVAAIKEVQRELFVKTATGKTLFYPPGGQSFTYIDDLLEGMFSAFERGKRGERYILAGHNLTFREYMTRVAQRTGMKPPRLPFPKSLLPWVGGLAELFSGKLGWEAGVVGRGYGFYSSQKAIKELGYKIRPLDSIINELLKLLPPKNGGG